MKLKLLIGLFLSLLHVSFGQIITWSPPFPMDQDSITVIFDATQGNQGLMGYTGDVYAHTGVLTNLSTSGSNWRYVKTNWGQNTPETKLERIGTDLYRFEIKPSARSFYNVPVSEQITHVCFVFRSGVPVGGNFLEGKTESGGDIFLPMFGVGLNVAIISPDASFLNPIFAETGDTITVEAISSHSDGLALIINDSLVTQTNDSTLIYDIIVNQQGKFWVKAEAYNNNLGQVKADSFYYVVNSSVQTATLPSGVKNGINYINNNTVTLVLYAPLKNFVYVIGDFTNWEVEPAFYMKKTPNDSLWWITFSGLTPQQEYGFQYYVDGEIRIADPYSEKVLDPWNDQFISGTTYPNLKPYPAGKTAEPVSVFQTNQTPYNWNITDFQRPAKTDLVIYELLIRDFLATHDYKTLIDTLGYLKNLGINAIELMPIMEFEGNESWGYNPSFHLAVDKYYGPKDDLKRFIDSAHANGIAIILDMVLNHAYGQSPLVRLYWDAANNRPAANNPWFNVSSPNTAFSFGNDFNHESQATKDFVDRVNRFWIEEYKFDGFRFDFTKGFTNTPGDGSGYDAARIEILERMADSIWEFDSTAYVILEHFAPNNEETILANYGMMLWGNHNCNYNQATMGYQSGPCGNWDFSGISYKNRGWVKPHLVGYMESHDEERLMFKNLQYGNSSGNYNIKNLSTALERIKLGAAFYFLIPGPKMIWQFGELGYDVSIDDPCRVCNKPIRWEYFSQIPRLNVYKVFSHLINLKKNYPAFQSTDFSILASANVKRIGITDSTMNVIIIGNFDVISSSIIPNFQSTGWWYDYFTGDSINVSNTTENITLQPGEFRIYTSVKLPTPEPYLVNDVEKTDDVVVTDFLLEQNYPNPFNPTTNIEFRIANSGFVSIKVYDILGREVKDLVNEELSDGIYKIDWNGDNEFGEKVSSGIYFYRLETGSFVNSRKMILMK